MCLSLNFLIGWVVLLLWFFEKCSYNYVRVVRTGVRNYWCVQVKIFNPNQNIRVSYNFRVNYTMVISNIWIFVIIEKGEIKLKLLKNLPEGISEIKFLNSSWINITRCKVLCTKSPMKQKCYENDIPGIFREMNVNRSQMRLN